jgi:hypothetical protein
MIARSISLVVIVILVACAAYLEWLPEKKPRAPAIPTVANCGKLKPGTRRIGDYGFQFDVPANAFTVYEGWGDMPPTPHGYGIKPNDGNSTLGVSWGSTIKSPTAPEIPALTSPGYVEKRKIVDDKGSVIGEDSWGYWKTGERWRRIQLLGRIEASYGSRNESELRGFGSAHEKDAALFDGIINSACRLPATPE